MPSSPSTESERASPQGSARAAPRADAPCDPHCNAMYVAVALLVLVLVGSPCRASSPDETDVPPLDFQAAFAAASTAAQQGHSVDEAVAIAGRVLNGEKLFEPISSPVGDGGSWLCARSWLSPADAKILQHEIVTSKGWPAIGDLDAPRQLRLQAPLPPWARDLAVRLAPALGGSEPDACDVYACEPGQRALLPEVEGTLALLSLGSDAALLTAPRGTAPAGYPFPSRSSIVIEERSALLLPGPADGRDKSFSHCVHSGRRHLSLSFHCSSSSSKTS